MQKTISSVRAVRNHQVCRRGRGGVSNRVRDDQQLVQNGRHQAKVFGEEFIEEFISDLKQSVRSEIGKKTTIDRRHFNVACAAINKRQPIPDHIMNMHAGLSKRNLVNRYHSWLKTMEQ